MASCDTMEKILVIDDEYGPRESLRILLKREYEVHCADSVSAGLQLLKEERPDAVILDVRMPGTNGIQGLREIRAIDPYVSVIMLTGYGALESAQEALRLGANDYLKKPFDAVNMQETIAHNVKRSRLERMRAEAAERLEEANRELITELDKREHLATLGQASAEFVHDLKNPLAGVLGYVELLAEQMDFCRRTSCARCREPLSYLEVIETDLRRCSDLLDMWQGFGKSASGGARMMPLIKLLKDVVRGLEPTARRHNAEVSVEIPALEIEVPMHGVQLYRAINNTLVNAIHAVSEKGGHVRVRCREVGLFVEVLIEDDGCGIPAEKLGRIFEPYFTTKEPGKGTGLGLYIARKAVEAHGGEITVDSEVEQGTCVTIRLPRTAPAGVG